MEDGRKVGRVLSFGNWDFSDDELPITQYFDARQAVLLHDHFFGEEGDLFKVPSSPLYYAAKGGGETLKPPRKRRTPRAVDEDLYKIPEELLRKKKQQQQQRKRVVRCDFWRRFLGLMCV